MDLVLIPPLPQGFRVAAVHAGLKKVTAREDVAIVMSDTPAVAAGVYTTNLICAAPVVFDRSRTPGSDFQAIVINSGNANACTGQRGMSDAQSMASLVAKHCGVSDRSVLVLSTGIIGEFLPMEKIALGIGMAANQLGAESESVLSVCRGMMTTDTRAKLYGEYIEIESRRITIFGMAKGAAMIGPRMATMLGVILTDAVLSPEDAQQLLIEATDVSFNCVSVDGHMSTNDTVLLLANGQTGGKPLAGDDLKRFSKSLTATCESLAKQIAEDGEGATHSIRIDVSGCQTREDARKVARTIADSPLVKTAIAGADPNWGRIVSAAGYSGVAFAPERIQLRLNGTLLYSHAAPVGFDAEAVSQSISATRETHIEVDLGDGTATIRFWSSDLTAEYVRLNADYHT
ncbi:MAG: bifunctional glutamate N-acetyltransferase/amino-acid acetyltransferase ArgJ [Planctomycetota bacterium]|nr:MAG: bifunctional glutamate N-acetyltransferase/amino-acid acetyltransferase ArgJ [Planctomycetota bacterium]